MRILSALFEEYNSINHNFKSISSGYIRIYIRMCAHRHTMLVVVVMAAMLPWIHTASDDSCGGYRVNERHTLCCNGLIYIRSGFRQACCDSVGYDSHHYMCCGQSILHKNGKASRCCGAQAYDAHLQQCKSGYLVDRTGIGSTCCQTHSGWRCCLRGEDCCSTRRDLEPLGSGSNTVDVPGFRPACCSMSSLTDRAKCCKTATEKAWVVPPCCETDDTLPICCVRPDGEWRCCSPSEGYCCGQDRTPARTRIPDRGVSITVRPTITRPVHSWVPPDIETMEPEFQPWVPPQTREPEHKPWVPPQTREPESQTWIPPRTRAPWKPSESREPGIRPWEPPSRVTTTTHRPRWLPTTTPTISRNTCCNIQVPHPSCCSSFRRRPQCCASTSYRPNCCSSLARLPYCCQTPQGSWVGPPNQLSPIDRTASCCDSPYPNHFCCPSSSLNHPQRPRPTNNCCQGPARPACCYVWYQRAHCCEDNSSYDSQYGSPDNTQDLMDQFKGQVSSCCSSSRKEQCCAHGEKLTGNTPYCCDDEQMPHEPTEPTLIEEPYYSTEDDSSEYDSSEYDSSEYDSSRYDSSEYDISEYDSIGYDISEDKSEEEDISVIIGDDEEDDHKQVFHSCCGVEQSELNYCCANGFRRSGIQPHCCGREIDGTPDKRGDIPGDLAYFYFADEPGDEGFGSCCNKTASELAHCCRDGYFTTGQALACCNLRLREDAKKKTQPTKTQPRTTTRPEFRQKEQKEKTCCMMSRTHNLHCCEKLDRSGPGTCCPQRTHRGISATIHVVSTKAVQAPPRNTAFSCCYTTSSGHKVDCCRTGMNHFRQHPDCCRATTQARHHPTSSIRPAWNVRGRQDVSAGRRNFSRDICGSRMYDMTTQICCSRRVSTKHGISPKCCGSVAYDARLYRCCPGDFLSRLCPNSHQFRYRRT